MGREATTRANARAELVLAWVCAICLAFTAIGFFVVSGYVPPPHADLSAPQLAGMLKSLKAPELASGQVDAFLCGPEAYLSSTQQLLNGMGLPSDHVHLERYNF